MSEIGCRRAEKDGFPSVGLRQLGWRVWVLIHVYPGSSVSHAFSFAASAVQVRRLSADTYFKNFSGTFFFFQRILIIEYYLRKIPHSSCPVMGVHFGKVDKHGVRL